MEKRVVEFALKFERRGTALYLETAAAVKNGLSKNLFYALAKQEVEHARRIDEFNLGASEQAYPAGYESIDSVEQEMKAFFKRVKGSVKRDEKNLGVYEVAMKLEKEGYAAYERFMNEATDAGEKKLLEFLLQEERNHIDAIANAYSYLSETSDWLQREESRTWNWMNI